MTLTRAELEIRRKAAIEILGAVQDYQDGRPVRYSALCRKIRLEYGMSDAFVRRVLQTDYQLTINNDQFVRMEEE